MYDGTSYHTSKFTIKFCLEVGFLYMNWSTKSLDLIPIENFWRIIEIKINGCRYWVYTVEELKAAIHKEWEQLTKENYRKFIVSIYKRCKQVIWARGGLIKY